MTHPLQVDLSKFTDQELDGKVQELNKRYFQAMRLSPSITGQIVLLLDSYKLEMQERQLAKAKKAAEEGENSINDLIKVT
jgi:hypothetical protein